MRPNLAPSSSIFIVNTENDMYSLPDGSLSLREAILVSEGLMSCGWVEPEKSLLTGCTWESRPRTASPGGCGLGYFDTIYFDSSVSEIRLWRSCRYSTTPAPGSTAGNPAAAKSSGSTWPVSFVADELIEIQGADVEFSNLVFVNGVISYNPGVVDCRAGAHRLQPPGRAPGSTSSDQPGVERSASTGIWVHGPTQPLSDRAFIYGNVIGCHSGDGISKLRRSKPVHRLPAGQSDPGWQLDR